MTDLGFPGGANSKGGRQTIFQSIFPENCMKMKKLGPGGGGARPKFGHVDQPLINVRNNL